MTKIAFLGIGAMGQRMVPHLVAAGHDVTTWNRSPTPDIGVTQAGAPKEAVVGAELVLAMLTDDEASRSVWLGDDGALQAMQSGAMAVEMSTLSPEWTQTLADQTRARGLSFIDAPVAGSRPQAEAGELVFLAGATPKDLVRFNPVAEAMGKAVLHAGDVGKGCALKLLINGLLAVQTAALAELLAWGEDKGFEMSQVVDLIAPVPVTSQAAAFVGGQIASGAHEPMFTVDLMEKDLRYLTRRAEMPLLAETRARFEAAQARGYGGKHITAVALA